MAKKKRYKSEVVKAFKKNNGTGKLIEYKVGDFYYTSHIETLEYLKKIKLIK